MNEKPDTPDVIYLFRHGDEIVWCDYPDPEVGMDSSDAVKYIKSPDQIIDEFEDEEVTG